ncbi:MAG TPA: ABC transporter ATP-binding protein [Thermoanaerobaculia bacterium]|nr:ABC transporter ATP-binding protein [Thermoanaerobaculia bacterium]
MEAAANSRTDPAIACRGLVKRFDDVVAVNGLDLEIAPGECFGLLGPNGAGKTTTIEILEGLTKPDAGEVAILGRHWGTHERELRARLGISLQDGRFPDKLTVFETLDLFRCLYPAGRDPERLLTDMSLEEKRDARVGKLSGGQRQRLAVACALAGDPEILFLDEPTTGLDPQSRRELWNHIETFRAAGRTVLLTTHYMEEAERLCDRVAIVDHGKTIAQGTPAELVASLNAPHIVEFASDPELSGDDLKSLPGVRDCRQRDSRWFVSVASLVDAVPALLSRIERGGAKLLQLSTHRATLEDVFISLTGRELRDE